MLFIFSALYRIHLLTFNWKNNHIQVWNWKFFKVPNSPPPPLRCNPYFQFHFIHYHNIYHFYRLWKRVNSTLGQYERQHSYKRKVQFSFSFQHSHTYIKKTSFNFHFSFIILYITTSSSNKEKVIIITKITWDKTWTFLISQVFSLSYTHTHTPFHIFDWFHYQKLFLTCWQNFHSFLSKYLTHFVPIFTSLQSH